MSQTYHQVPKVQCPVRVAMGHSKGGFDYLVVAAAKQIHRFPNATLKR